MKRMLTSAIIALLTTGGLSADFEKATFPVDRVLTDTAGRKFSATILEKSATAIKCKRTSDGVEFSIELTKLSAADRSFIAGLDKTVVANASAVSAETQTDSGHPAKLTKPPCPYTLTSPDGNKIGGTIVGKGPLAIRFQQETDGRVIPIAIDRLSAKDRAFVDSISGDSLEVLPLPINLIYKSGAKLDATILKRSGKDHTAFICKRTSDGKEVNVEFHEFSPETQKKLSLIATQESTPLPACCTLTTNDKRTHRVTILETSDTEIKGFRNYLPEQSITIPIADLDEASRKYVAAPWKTITGVPRRFKFDVTLRAIQKVIPAGNVVWVQSETDKAIWFGENFIPYDKAPTERGNPPPNLADPPLSSEDLKKILAARASAEAALKPIPIPADLALDMAVPKPPNPKFWYWPHSYGGAFALGMPRQSQIQYLWGALQVTTTQMDKLMGLWLDIVVKACNEDEKQYYPAIAKYATEREAILTDAQKDTRRKIVNYYAKITAELKAQGLSGEGLQTKAAAQAMNDLPGILTPLETRCWHAVEDARKATGGTPGK